jgi:hypothetical protein
MTKTVTLTYGSVDIPTNITPGDVLIALVNGAGEDAQFIHVPYGTPSADVSVVTGTGYKFRVENRDSNGALIPGTSPILTDAFDVSETQSVQVVLGAAIA